MNKISSPLIYLLAVVAGCLQGFSLTPATGWLQILATTLIFLLLAHSTKMSRLAGLSFVYGVSWLTVALSWIEVSVNQFGGLPKIAAWGAVVALSAGLALFYVLAAILYGFFRGEKKQRAGIFSFFFLLPPLWTLATWTRSTVLTGFGWGAGSYAHVNDFFFEYAPWIGSLGIDFLTALTAGALGYAVLCTVRTNFSRACVALLVPVLLYFGALGLSHIEFASPKETVSFRLIQGGIGQGEKFSPFGTQQAFQRYLQGMKEPGLQKDTVIILPETIFPVPINRLSPQLLDTFLHVNKTQGNPMIFGGFVVDADKNFHNSAIYFDNQGKESIYNKRHLVPFGEFVPFGFRWFVDMLQIPMADQKGGTVDQKPFDVNGNKLAVSLCYEDLFPMEIRDWWEQGNVPNVLINLSNLAWFGDSSALPQHLAISRMRAKEFARPIVRATNSGVTAAIDHQGNVVKELPFIKPGILDVSVLSMQGEPTPYTRFGNWPILILCFVLIVIGTGRIRLSSERIPH